MGSDKKNGMGSWARRGARVSLVVTAISATTVGIGGCRVSDDDVHQWARKASGPKRLIAVLTHDKYAPELRVEAALTLVTMKPRGGRAVGLVGGDDFDGLLAALTDMPAEERQVIVVGLVPKLETGINAAVAADGVDTSFAYKDAAFALLTQENGTLVTDLAARDRLIKALTLWTQNRFEKRFDDTSQLYGMEQVLRLLRADGVRGLSALIAPDFKKVDSVARLIHELGDEETQVEASAKLVQLARFVDSDEWLKKKKPALEAANAASKLKVSEKQFQVQLATYQEEELMRAFAAMKSVGKKPTVDYLLDYATNDKNPEKRRAAALAGLEGNLDRENPAHAKAVLDVLASDATPDTIRDIAARRIGELPRAQVAERLYSLFGNKRWQVRWSVASLLLKMSEAKHLDEFMTRLGKIRDMAMSEPLSYGPLLNDLKGDKPENLVERYSKPSEPVPVRLTALSYYYRYGSKADLPKVEIYKDDGRKVPNCAKDAEGCEWSCSIVENKTQVAKEVKTVGDFVSYCIVPTLSVRDPTPPTPAQQTPSEK